MTIRWDSIRYRGDAADVDELFATYRVEDYLAAFEENVRQRDRGMREELLKSGVRLTERLSPRIYRIFHDVCQRLELEATAEVFCIPDAEVNAFAHLEVREKGTSSLVGVTAGALEKLEDGELRSILGHEMGHFLFGNNRLNALISTDEENPSATVLPPLGEALFLRWRKKAEISADRVGLLASGDFEVSAKALLKATFGLSERNLNLDVEALLAQVDEIRGRPELMDEEFESHPLLPIRLKALELFARSSGAAAAGYPVEGGGGLADAALEDAVDELVLLTRRYPREPLEVAKMRAIALGGALLLGADGDISDDEVKILIQVLHQFTDEPEGEVVTDRGQILEQLPAVAQALSRDGDDAVKGFVLSRLADVALADGALMDAEGEVILKVAEMLGVPSRVAYSVMVGAAQAVGFRTDVKLNRMAERLRQSLQMGLSGSLARRVRGGR